MAQSGHIIQFYKSRINILDILKSQGYNISNYEGSGINEVNSMFNTTQLDMLLTKNDESKKVYIKYHLAKTLSHTNISEYIDDLYNLETVLTKKDDLIIIMKDEPNETIRKTLTDIWEKEGIFIIVINIKRLQYNILNHQLVPEHIVLTAEEASEVKRKYNIHDDSQIPDISRFSPVSQVIGLRPGELCRIYRPSKTAIKAEFYRICFNK